MAINLGLIFLLIGIVAMVVGPIMMLQPSAAQRRQENLRARAAHLGLRVKIVSLPQQATQSEQPAAIPVYCLPHEPPGQSYSPWLLLRGTFAHEAHFFEAWQWHGTTKAAPLEQEWLRKNLASLPGSVAALECGQQGICVYWTEAGGEKVLEGISALLSSFPGRVKR